MQTLEFNAEELEVLRELLEHKLVEVDFELFHTDSHDFKSKLKRHREIIEQVLSRVSVVSAAA